MTRTNTQNREAQRQAQRQHDRLSAQADVVVRNMMQTAAQRQRRQAQAEAQTETEEGKTFAAYADRYAQAAETVRDTHFLLSIPAIRNTAVLADSYRQRQQTAWTEATDTARTLANIIAASVCKKCDNVAASDMTRQLRTSRTQDVRRMEEAADRIAAEVKHTVTQEGDTEEEYTNNYADVAAVVFDTLFDGVDLYHTAFETILSEGADGIDFSFIERILDKRVSIRMADSAAWKEVETTAGQRAFRAVRALIEDSRAAIDNNRYCYLSEIVKDTDSGTEAEAAEAILYHRLPKYFAQMDTTQDSGYSVHPLPVTVSNTDAEEAQTLCEQAAASLAEQFKLSAQQKDVLAFLFMGYGRQAIATFIGMRKDGVKMQTKRIRQKVTDSAWYNEHTAAQRQAEAVLFMLDTEAQDSKTAAQRATEATDSAQKAAQAADVAQNNAFRAAQKAASLAHTATRTANTAAEKAEAAAALCDFWKAAQAAQKADKTARTAQAAARTAQAAADVAQAAARRERAARLHR